MAVVDFTNPPQDWYPRTRRAARMGVDCFKSDFSPGERIPVDDVEYFDGSGPLSGCNTTQPPDTTRPSSSCFRNAAGTEAVLFRASAPPGRSASPARVGRLRRDGEAWPDAAGGLSRRAWSGSVT